MEQNSCTSKMICFLLIQKGHDECANMPNIGMFLKNQSQVNVIQLHME